MVRLTLNTEIDIDSGLYVILLFHADVDRPVALPEAWLWSCRNNGRR